MPKQHSPQLNHNLTLKNVGNIEVWCIKTKLLFYTKSVSQLLLCPLSMLITNILLPIKCHPLLCYFKRSKRTNGCLIIRPCTISLDHSESSLLYFALFCSSHLTGFQRNYHTKRLRFCVMIHFCTDVATC